jgi:hypothetical protein
LADISGFRRVAQLEKKIDGIVSLLAASQYAQPPPTNASPSSGPSPLSQHSVENAQRVTRFDSNRAEETRQLTDGRGNEAAFELFPSLRLTFHQAATCLDLFRTEYMPKFPFVIIPTTVDAGSLYDQSACLFWTVMATVARCFDDVDAEFKQWFRRHIAEHVVVRQEKSLELLQAILLYLSWYARKTADTRQRPHVLIWLHVRGELQFYIDAKGTALLHLANTLVAELKLDRDPAASGITPRSSLGAAWVKNRGPSQTSVAHTDHERRAVLGFYHIASM